MEDLRFYDSAIMEFQGKLKSTQMPLHSWDVYGAFLSGLSENIIDAQKLNLLAAENKWEVQFDFQSELQKDTVIVVTNPKIEIVFSSRNMVKMNGYKPEEVLGKSPKIFQGEATNKVTSKKISDAIREWRPFDEIIVNHNKAGRTYDCHIKGYPIFNKNRELVHFIAFENVA